MYIYIYANSFTRFGDAATQIPVKQCPLATLTESIDYVEVGWLW